MMSSSDRAIVVGAGPVGCILALELAHHGVPSLVLERHPGPALHPKMDYISGRSMEHLRRLGLADLVRDAAIDETIPTYFRWCQDLASPLLATWQHASAADHRARSHEANDGSAALEPYLRVQGSTLEGLLRQRVVEEPLVELRTGINVVGVSETARGVDVIATSGRATPITFHGSFVAGCDGGGSLVRESLGISLEHASESRRSHSIYFRSSDPRLRPWGPAFITVCGSGVTLVSRDEGDLWTASFPVTAGRDEPPVSMLRRLLGVPIEIDEVIDQTQWTGSMAVADRYRKGRAFLAGDAVHQFFPTGGHGANTGIADAVDLGWKWAAVLGGSGGPTLLESYEAERRPVALLRREMSANLLEVWQRFRRLCALGAPTEMVAGFLEQERYQPDNLGVHFGDRYAGSPVIVASDDDVDHDWSWSSISGKVRPGRRLPSVRLEDGAELHDRLSAGLTLVDATETGAGHELMSRAESAKADVSYLEISDGHVREVLGHQLVLVRADRHVGWSGPVGAIADAGAWGDVIGRVCGRA